MVELQDFGRAESAAIDADGVDEPVEETIDRNRDARTNARGFGSDGPIGSNGDGSHRAVQPRDLFGISVEMPSAPVVDSSHVNPDLEIEIVERCYRGVLSSQPGTSA